MNMSCAFSDSGRAMRGFFSRDILRVRIVGSCVVCDWVVVMDWWRGKFGKENIVGGLCGNVTYSKIE